MPDRQVANGFLAWAPDGRRLAGSSIAAAGASTLTLVEPGATAPYRQFVEFDAVGRPRGMTWTHDGEHVIVANEEFPADIVLFDIVRDERRAAAHLNVPSHVRPDRFAGKQAK